MANVFSPQVITREVDVSSIAPAVSSSIAAIVGVAAKGPINEPQFVSTPEQFIDIFGEPIATNPYLGFAALNFLRQGNQLWVTRIASVKGADAIAFANTDTRASITSNPITTFGFSQTLNITIDGNAVSIPLSATQTTTVAAIANAINLALDTSLGTLGIATVVDGNKIKIETVSKDSRKSTISCVTNITDPIYFPVVTGFGERTVFTAEALTPATLTSSSAEPFNTNVTYASVSGNSSPIGTLYNVSNLSQDAYGVFSVTGKSFTASGNGKYTRYKLTFNSNPSSGQTITFTRPDVSSTTPVTFTFVTSGPSSSTDVLIGITLAETLNNLKNTINAYSTTEASTVLNNAKYPEHGVRAESITQNGTNYELNLVGIAPYNDNNNTTVAISSTVSMPVSPTLISGTNSDFIAITVPNTLAASVEQDVTYFFLAGEDFVASATATLDSIASSIAQAINIRSTYESGKSKAFTASAASNQVTVRAYAGSKAPGNGITVALDHNGYLTPDPSSNMLQPVDLGTSGNLKHGFNERPTYAFASITVDGVTKSHTDFAFDLQPVSKIPNKHEATIQQICDIINEAFGTLIAVPQYSGANEFIKITSPTPGVEGTVSVTASSNIGTNNDPFGTVTGSPSTGTGDNHIKLLIDNKYTVNVFLTQSATLSAEQLAKDINDVAVSVHPSLKSLAKVVSGTVVLTSPSKGSYADFGSRIEVLNGAANIFPITSVEGTGYKRKAITIKAATPGSWANDIIEVSFSDEDPLFASPYSTRVDVYVNGTLAESFRECVLNPSANGTTGTNGQGVFIEKAINGVSKYITIDFDDDLFDTNPDTFINSVKIVPNTSRTGSLPPYKLSGGADGISRISDADVIGVASDPVSGKPTGLQVYADTEKIFINLLAAPGFTSQAVANELINIAEQRQDTLAIIDPPLGLKTQEVVDWHNGLGHGRSSALNTSYAATYNTWLKEYDPYNDQIVTLPPSCFVLAQMAYNDSVAEPWFATAGLTRGRITLATDVVYNAGLGERELMYGQGNRINPIPKFVKEGIVIWGNSTLYRQESALREITVRRLLNYAKVVISLAAKVILFEPNDPSTSKRLLDIINPVLYDIQVRRGLTKFSVIDATTDRDRNLNRMVVRIFLQPARTVEVIDIPFVITRQGGSFVI